MAKQKVTITVDRAKVDEARRLTGAATTSAAIDTALTELVRRERLRRDLAAYAATPSTADELALAHGPVDRSDLADDTDWGAVYGDDG